MGKLVKIRYYQFMALMGGIFFYSVVYRRFLYPRPVRDTAAYSQAVSFIKADNQVKAKIGSKVQVMNCNGKQYPYRYDVKFDVVLFGQNQNGKVKVVSYYDKVKKSWRLKTLDLITRTETVSLLKQ